MSDNQHFKEAIIYGGMALSASLITSLIYGAYNGNNVQEQDKKRIRQYISRIPLELRQSLNCLLDELKYLESPTCEIMQVPHLIQDLKMDCFPEIISPLFSSEYIYGGEGFLPIDSFVYRDSFTLNQCQFGPKDSMNEVKRWLSSGPRKNIFFKPEEVRACIVTCGGLCPGLNDVIREIVNSLYNNYQVSTVFGIQFGYKGFYAYPWIKLNPQNVKDIHCQGGTILGSSRGGFDLDQIIQAIQFNQINQIYLLGGDGTHKGINVLFQHIKTLKISIGIVGLPKTIDNDIPIIDKSFGFDTAVEEATKAIKSAYVESHSCEYGVGLVRLMGRNAGFIAMEASSASRDVNICLVPEFKFELYGKQGLLQYIYNRLKARRHCVIVVAEGADNAMKDCSLPNQGKDASGNVKSGDIGIFLREQIVKYCKEQMMDVTLKYIDPAYMIRSVQANPHDKEVCSQLGQSATHGLMAGFTGFSVGHVNNNLVFIPLQEIISNKYTNTIQSNDRHWQRLLASTGQPSFLNTN